MIFGCSKKENENFSKPAITISGVSDITNTTAICEGNLTSDGSKIITSRGVVWHI